MCDKESPGNRLRRIYYREINARDHTNLGKGTFAPYDGGTAANGRVYTRKWDKWAGGLLSVGIDIEDYCQLLFVESSPTTPDKLCSDRTIAEFYRLEGKIRKDLRLRWDSEERILMADIERRLIQGQTMEDALPYTLFDNSLSVESLTRYAFAAHNGCSEAAEFYREDAYAQYKRYYRIYNKECPERIPSEFRERVDNEYG